MPENMREKYLGQKNVNNQGYEMEVVGYENYDHAQIKFAPPYEGIITAKICHFKDGGIHNPFAPTVSEYGITGNKYSTHNKDGSYMLEYLTWCNMIKRCVDEKIKEKCPSYKDVTCSPCWQFYENFYEWMHEQENFETLLKQNDINLDKDILIKGNKVYGPDKCTLVPRRINNLMLKSEAIRGQYPIGVYYLKRNKKFTAHEGSRKNTVYLGLYDTPEDAFIAYKDYKENRIKEIAEEEYKNGNITKKCYDALVKYKVEITD